MHRNFTKNKVMTSFASIIINIVKIFLGLFYKNLQYTYFNIGIIYWIEEVCSVFLYITMISVKTKQANVQSLSFFFKFECQKLIQQKKKL